MRTHPRRVSYFPLRSGWFGFVRGFGFEALGSDGRVCWFCSVRIFVAVVLVKPG